MANINNDTKILELKKQIEEKKRVLSERKSRFTPETNCVLELDGSKYNLNVLDEESLTMIMIKLNSYRLSANDLEIELPAISGYSIELWINDVKSKLNMIKTKQEESKLKAMESKLDKLLSDDKKTELEISEIAALLK